MSSSDIRRAKAEEHVRQRRLVGAVVGPEELESLQRKLHPRNFTGMSGKMTAIVGYILEAHWTEPAIDEMAVTSDGYVFASHEGIVGMNAFVGSISDVERNWEGLLDAAELTLEERANAERLFMVKVADHRIGPQELL